MENIHRKFRQELGYTNATNQYVELARRKFTRAYPNEIKNNGMSKIAKGEGLSLSDLTEDYNLRIAKSYIVSVYTCLDSFLVNYKSLPGSPTNVTSKSRGSDESLLEWTWRIVGSSGSQTINNSYLFCDYYRLVRNRIVHNGASDSELKQRFSSIVKLQDTRLNAPNRINVLTFDDQVLLSRSAFNLVDYLYYSAIYDISTIIKAHSNELYKLIKVFQGDNDNIKAQKKMKKMLEAYYPPMNSVNWDEALQLVKREK